MSWIKVLERMPRIGDDVIVYVPRSYRRIQVQRVFNGGKGEMHCSVGVPVFGIGHNKGDSEEVTHWQPNPAFPSN